MIHAESDDPTYRDTDRKIEDGTMRRAIVTGGSRGIGYAIAKAILRDGGRVAITGRDRGRVDKAVELLGHEFSGPDRVIGAPVDVRDREAVDALVATVASAF